MISAWHLLWIIPSSVAAGAMMMAALTVAAWTDDWEETEIDK